MKSVISILIFASLSSVLSTPLTKTAPRPQPPIIGGEEIDISERPFQVVLRHYGSFQCGGSILSPNWILTAAHCLKNGIAPADVSFRIGSSNVRAGGYVVTARNYTLHPKYDPKKYFFDAAVVYLEEPLTFGENVAPIEVIEEDVSVGAVVEVSGWGLTENSIYPDILRNVRLDVIENEDCSALLSNNITQDMVCATAPQKDSCNGDSGSPLTYKDLSGSIYQAGLVSWGPTICGSNPGVYTRLSHPEIREFIRGETGL